MQRTAAASICALCILHLRTNLLRTPPSWLTKASTQLDSLVPPPAITAIKANNIIICLLHIEFSLLKAIELVCWG
jgi:hypothetical protein